MKPLKNYLYAQLGIAVLFALVYIVVAFANQKLYNPFQWIVDFKTYNIVARASIVAFAVFLQISAVFAAFAEDSEDSPAIKIILQGKFESYEDYQASLNEILKQLHKDGATDLLVVPSASADGRLCSIINYKKLTNNAA